MRYFALYTAAGYWEYYLLTGLLPLFWCYRGPKLTLVLLEIAAVYLIDYYSGPVVQPIGESPRNQHTQIFHIFRTYLPRRRAEKISHRLMCHLE